MGGTGTPAAGAGTEGESGWLAHVPVGLFAATMGLGGLGLAWRAAGHGLGWPAAVGEAVLALAALVFAATVLLYGAKAARHPALVAAEFEHPVRINFFPAASIGLLLLAAAALPYGRGAAEALWVAGAVLHLGFAITIIGRWITRNVEITHSSPAWFIPVVGNIVVPLAGVPLGHGEVSWFFFAIGIVFWIVLFTIVLYRIIFHDPLPARFVPMLFILLAPPAIGFVAYDRLTDGALDGFGRTLFFTALFIALLLASMAGRFLKVPFAHSWWAYTFPSAALAAAALRYHAAVPGAPSYLLAVGLLLIATAIVGAVAVRTLAMLATGRLFVPE